MGLAPEQLIRLVGMLALLVGGALLAGRMLRGAHGRPAAPLRVLARLSLGKGGALFLVAAGGRRFLVGVGEQGPRLLAELDAPQVERERRPAGPVDGVPASLGLELLSDLASDGEDGPGTGLVERLRRMTLRTSGRSRAVLR